MLTMLGIPNCDTVKKAQRYLAQHDIPFTFRDIRRQPLTGEEWRRLVAQDAEGKLVNTRSPSFRETGLKAAELNADDRVAVLSAKPTAMKRPVMTSVDGNLLSVGFSEQLFERYQKREP